MTPDNMYDRTAGLDSNQYCLKKIANSMFQILDNKSYCKK